MVVFTCNHCGDSVQKPKAAKHYETKCRNKYPDLCCVDCLKDFKGEEFTAHTKCVSEAERYGGKGFVPKPGQNKGERKQNAWIEIVQSVISDNRNISAPLKKLLEKISTQPNTPRKENKFFNFVKSLDKYTSQEDAEKLWRLLKPKLELLKSEPSNKLNGVKEEKSEEKSNSTEESVNGTDNNEGGEEVKTNNLNTEEKPLSKKERKQKMKLENAETPNEEIVINKEHVEENKTNNTEEKPLSKKERKRKMKLENAETPIEEIVTNKEQVEENKTNNLNTEEKPLSKKERKLKRKLENAEAPVEENVTNNKHVEEIETTNINAEEKSFSKKEKKQKRNPENIMNDDNVENKINNFNTEENALPEKERKRKRKDENVETLVEENATNNVNLEENTVNNDNIEEKPLSKKEKKEKKKREKYEAELREIESKETEKDQVVGDESVSNDTVNKKSKKKVKNSTDDGVLDDTSIQLNGKASKKRKTKEGTELEANTNHDIPMDSEEPPTKKSKTNNLNTDEKLLSKKEKKSKDDLKEFDWIGAITSVVASKNKQIAVKKLQKKVLTEYCAINNVTEVTERINKKFYNTLKNIQNIQVNGENASLVE